MKQKQKKENAPDESATNDDPPSTSNTIHRWYNYL
jgi:hypothetical protein